MSERTCSIRDCETKAYCRGLCSRHYQRAHRAGTLPPLQLALQFKPTHALSNVDSKGRTGDCSVCGPAVPVRIRQGRGPECGRKHRQGKWDRGDRRESRRRYRLASYGLTEEQYEAMVVEQDRACRICQDVPPVLCVDHDHATGEVRGLLCSPCNVALGLLRDRAHVAEAAAAYLRRER